MHLKKPNKTNNKTKWASLSTVLLIYRQRYAMAFPKVTKQVNWSQGKSAREFLSTTPAHGLNFLDGLKSNQYIWDTEFGYFDLNFWGQYLERRKMLQGN